MLASGVVGGWYQRRLPVDSLSPVDVQPICELSRDSSLLSTIFSARSVLLGLQVHFLIKSSRVSDGM